MRVRIDHFDNIKLPQKIVFDLEDLERLLKNYHFPHITAWQTKSYDRLPAMRVRVKNPPAHLTAFEIPDVSMHLSLERNGNHFALNSVLIFHGLTEALASQGVEVTAAEKREKGHGSALATRVNAQVAPT